MSKLKPTVREVYDINRSEIEQLSLENTFFHRIRLQNGVYKTTYANRFKDVNESLIKYLNKEQELYIMDVAISAGISTYEWNQMLSQSGIKHKMYASDISLYGKLHPITKFMDILLDSNNYPLQFDLLNRSIPSSSSSLIPSIIQSIFRAISSISLNIIQSLHMSKLINIGNPNGSDVRNITLVTKQLINNPDFTLLEESISTPTPENLLNKFNVLRAANILNKSYFDDTTLTNMVINLKSRLKTNGLIVVCRTCDEKDGTNTSTTFKKTDNGNLEILERIGSGSEIENLIMETNH